MKNIYALSGVAVLAILAIIGAIQLFVQYTVVTTDPSAARYELIYPYLLDRYSGDVWRMGTHSTGWHKMNKQPHGNDVVPKAWRGPAYQLKTTGHGAEERVRYLINIITGATWSPASDRVEGIFWKVVPGPE